MYILELTLTYYISLNFLLHEIIIISNFLNNIFQTFMFYVDTDGKERFFENIAILFSQNKEND